jgi:hypothetical protein
MVLGKVLAYIDIVYCRCLVVFVIYMNGWTSSEGVVVSKFYEWMFDVEHSFVYIGAPHTHTETTRVQAREL